MSGTGEERPSRVPCAQGRGRDGKHVCRWTLGWLLSHLLKVCMPVYQKCDILHSHLALNFLKIGFPFISYAPYGWCWHFYPWFNAFFFFSKPDRWWNLPWVLAKLQRPHSSPGDSDSIFLEWEQGGIHILNKHTWQFLCLGNTTLDIVMYIAPRLNNKKRIAFKFKFIAFCFWNSFKY